MKTDKDCKNYDHFEHLALNQRPDKGHDSNDTYANVHAEGFDSNKTYSHMLRGQYFHTELCTYGHKGENDDTYEHTKNTAYGDSDAYDHFHWSYHDGIEQSSDFAYAHAQKAAVTKGVYDHAAYDDGNGNDILWVENYTKEK